MERKPGVFTSECKLKDELAEKKELDYKTYTDDSTPDYFKEDLFVWKNRLYMKTGGTIPEFLVIDRTKNIIEEINLRKSGEEWVEGKNKVVARFSVNKIFEYQPLDKEMSPTYSMEIQKRDKSKLEIKNGSLSDLIGELRSHGGLLLKDRDVVSMINTVIAMTDETGNLIQKFEPPYPGFFLKDDEVITTTLLTYPSSTEVRNALQLLHRFADNYEEFKPGLSFVLHWQIVAPFSYVKKQKKQSDKMGALYLYGSSRAGKSTTALLSCHIWGREISDCFVGAGMLHSEASYGKNISEHTYPVILDEGERVFDAKNPELASVFKNSILYPHARGRYNPITKKYENIPALSSPIITSNASEPTNAALGGRMYSIEYIMNKPRTKDEILEFSKEFDPENDNGPLKALRPLGMFAGYYMIDEEETLDKPWEEASEEIWAALYTYAGIEMPEWISKCGESRGLEEAWEEEENELYNMFKMLVFKNADVGEVFDHKEGDKSIFRTRTIEDQVNYITKGKVEPWIEYRESTRGATKGIGYIEVDSGISKAFEKEFRQTVSLKILANNLGAKYQAVKRGGRSVKVARWTHEEFIAMFTEDDSDDPSAT